MSGRWGGPAWSACIAANEGGAKGGGPVGSPDGGLIPDIIPGGIIIPGRGGGGTPGIIGSRAPPTPGKRAPGGSGGGGGNMAPVGGFGAANALDRALLALKAAAFPQIETIF